MSTTYGVVIPKDEELRYVRQTDLTTEILFAIQHEAQTWRQRAIIQRILDREFGAKVDSAVAVIAEASDRDGTQFRKGWKGGHAAGMKEGMTVGRKEGMKEGIEVGKRAAWKDVREDGRKAGYREAEMKFSSLGHGAANLRCEKCDRLVRVDSVVCKDC